MLTEFYIRNISFWNKTMPGNRFTSEYMIGYFLRLVICRFILRLNFYASLMPIFDSKYMKVIVV